MVASKVMFVLTLALAIVALAAAKFEYTQEFQDWKVKYNKVYETKETELERQIIWESNKKFVENHNANSDKFGFTVAMNEFADLDADAFFKLKKIPSHPAQANNNNNNVLLTGANVPNSIDWRKKGAVTPVSNQGQCGVWPWPIVGSVESQYFIKTGTLVPLSVQQILDCANITNLDEAGAIYKYLTKVCGIEPAKDYPKSESCKGPCKYDPSKALVGVKGFADIPRGDEEALMEAVANIGPIPVTVDAGHSSFQLYSSGVYYDASCSSSELDHAMLVVGYGSEDGKDYWIVKNSWGTSWGMDGYILMSRNRKNNCGIASFASYPILD